MKNLAQAAFLGVIFTGCGFTQLYPGERLSEEKVSRIDVDECTLYGIFDGEMWVAKKPALSFSTGFEVLPGRHMFVMEHSTESDFTNCKRISRTDSYGYNSCQTEQWQKNPTGGGKTTCRSCDFETVEEICDVIAHPRRCEGVLMLEPGKTYTLSGCRDRSLYLDGNKIGSCKDNPAYHSTSKTVCGTGCYVSCPHLWFSQGS